jgi:hypothetical protein
MNPDYEIEQYWLGLKKSMINFYENKNYSRPIIAWSNNLNKLQKLKKYELIEDNIKNYISLYAIDLIKSVDMYHSRILKTNIKRWNKISNKYNFNIISTTQNIIFVLFLIYIELTEKNVDSNILNIFYEIELTILYKNYNSLIKYCVENNKPTILEKLNKIIDIKNILKNIYNLDDKYKDYGFKKIIQILN